MENKFCISEDIFVEVGEFKGKQRIDIRKWYFKSNGESGRSSNGLNIDVDTWNDLVAKFDEIKTFVEAELAKKK